MSSAYTSYRDDQPASGTPSSSKNYAPDDQLTIKLRLSPWMNNASANLRQSATNSDGDEFMQTTNATPATHKPDEPSAHSPSSNTGQSSQRNRDVSSPPTPQKAPSQSTDHASATPIPSSSSEVKTPVSQSWNTGDSSIGSGHHSDKDTGGAHQKSKKIRNRKLKRSTTRNKMRMDKQDGLLGEEDAHDAGHFAAGSIWKTVEIYFSDFNEEDLKYCAVESPSDFQEYLTIPSLGTKKTIESKPKQITSDVVNSLPFKSGAPEATGMSYVFTSRLISALIEELTFTPPIFPFFNNMSRNDAKYTPSAHVHEHHPFGVFSAQELDFIEQCVQKELIMLDMFKENGPAPDAQNTKELKAELPSETDEDDLVKELKKLQGQLKDQISMNNELREELSKNVKTSVELRKGAKENWEALAKEENLYVQQLKQLIKNKKKKLGKSSVKTGGEEG